MSDVSVLETELETYKKEKKRLLSEGHKGKYVLIKGKEILGIFETEEEGCNEGFRRFLAGPFLVQKIARREERIFFPFISLDV